jgi:hypothetical protein
MGINVVKRFGLIELSPAAYDEIERQLLDAGYEFAFMRGPGSIIDLKACGIEYVERAKVEAHTKEKAA